MREYWGESVQHTRPSELGAVAKAASTGVRRREACACGMSDTRQIAACNKQKRDCSTAASADAHAGREVHISSDDESIAQYNHARVRAAWRDGGGGRHGAIPPLRDRRAARRCRRDSRLTRRGRARRLQRGGRWW
eukprot:IDg16105t1